jgi:hypothetical protein
MIWKELAMVFAWNSWGNPQMSVIQDLNLGLGVLSTRPLCLVISF